MEKQEKCKNVTCGIHCFSQSSCFSIGVDKYRESKNEKGKNLTLGGRLGEEIKQKKQTRLKKTEKPLKMEGRR